VLYDTLLHPDYNGDIRLYHGRMSMVHGLDKCEVSMTIPLNPAEPWMGIIIGIELDDTIEQMAQVTLTSFYGSRLADTAAIPITLFPIRNQGDPVWKQCLEVVSDPKGPHFHTGMATMAKYVQYSFNLQHNLAKTGIRQCLSMAAYDEHIITISCELVLRMGENDILYCGTIPPSDQDCELKVAYHRLSEAEHGWNYT
jgi:hypothetical protein